MIANYHTHSVRCRHAVGTEEEYFQAASAAGLRTLGFSDHTPYWFPGDYYSTFRMYPEQLEDYARSVRAVREQHRREMEIFLGVEAEFYPRYFPELLPRLRDAGIEYMLLGQHFVGDEIGCHYCGRPTDDPDMLRQYCRQVRDGMQTGLFTYVAHPDLLYFTGSPTVYRQEMAGLCRDASSCGIPLEVNLLGLCTGRHYPAEQFWSVAAEEGCQAILGRDAHNPRQFGDLASEETAMELVHRFDLPLLQQVQLRSVE